VISPGAGPTAGFGIVTSAGAVATCHPLVALRIRHERDWENQETKNSEAHGPP
jgi:hypothetical protein